MTIEELDCPDRREQARLAEIRQNPGICVDLLYPLYRAKDGRYYTFAVLSLPWGAIVGRDREYMEEAEALAILADADED